MAIATPKKPKKPKGLPKTLSFAPAKAPPSDVSAGPTVADVEKMKSSARARVPSEPWLDVQFPQHIEINADDEEVMVTQHQPGQFPPGGDLTAMVRCLKCGVLHPPTTKTYGGRGWPLCVDHVPNVVNDAYGPSPSATAIRQAAAMHANTVSRKSGIDDRKVDEPPKRVIMRELPSEKKSELRREIKRQLKREV
jgi:hypothetical protein